MIIDTHVHVFRPTDSKGQPQKYSPNPTSGEDYVATMDAAGIDRAFLISFSPDDILADLEGKNLTVEDVKDVMTSEYTIKVIRRYPDRFYWFPCHLNPINADYLERTQKNLDLGAAGLKILPSFFGLLPDNDRLLPLYELAQKYRVSVILDLSFWYLTKGTTRTGFRDVAPLVKDYADLLSHVEPVVDEFSDVNFQLAHAGTGDLSETGEFMARYPNVFADISARFPGGEAYPFPKGLLALKSLVTSAGVERVMFGTDWPHFWQGARMKEIVRCLSEAATFMTPDERALVLGGNALRFVGQVQPELR
ncbi:amidohydrolase [Candidatus Poribacteria bacterium]|nr:amidohydrolase [Candidatus Poribacteria bacterium]